MTRPLRLPTAMSEVDDIKRRLFDLERKVGLTQSDTRPTTEPEIVVFSQGGDATAVSTTEVSGRYHPLLRRKLSYVLCTLATSGSTTTTVSIKKNGTEITTVSLASSDTFEEKTLSTVFAAATDYLTVAATAAGTGAEGLTVQAKFI